MNVLFSINSFTGKLMINLSHHELDHWCLPVMYDLTTLVKARSSLKECVEKLYERVILWTIKHYYEQTCSDWTVNFSYYEDDPCLLIPCLSDIQPNSQIAINYQLFIRLSHNTMHRDFSFPSFVNYHSRTHQGEAMSYHSVNNKMNALGEYPDNVEIGFDIDGDNNEHEDDESSQGKWVVDVCGVRVKRDVWELLELVHKSVIVTDLGSQDFLDQTCYSIKKLLPRLRFEALLATMTLLRDSKLIQSFDGSRDSTLLSVGVVLAFHRSV